MNERKRKSLTLWSHFLLARTTPLWSAMFDFNSTHKWNAWTLSHSDCKKHTSQLWLSALFYSLTHTIHNNWQLCLVLEYRLCVCLSISFKSLVLTSPFVYCCFCIFWIFQSIYHQHFFSSNSIYFIAFVVFSSDRFVLRFNSNIVWLYASLHCENNVPQTNNVISTTNERKICRSNW